MQQDQKSAGFGDVQTMGEDGTPKESKDTVDNHPQFHCVNGLIQIQKTDTVGLEYQVAGHSRVGLLTHKLGYVLKPVQKDPLGPREITFYRTLTKHIKHNCSSATAAAAGDIHVQGTCESSQEDCLDLIGSVVPKFYGVAELIDGDSSLEKFLVLENIVQGLESPSIVDLKIGVQTWSPDATDKKIEHEKSKYLGTKSQLGICVTGMHYYDLVTGEAVRCPEGFGKTLTTESIYTALRQFLNASSCLDKLVARLILEKLQPIKRFFSVQHLYNFYSSSILIAYDAKFVATCLEEMKNTAGSHSGSIDSLRASRDRWLRVWMIDFAHVHPNPNGMDLDLNYIYGLDNLITILMNIINQAPTT